MDALIDWCTCTFEFDEDVPRLLQRLGLATGLQLSAGDRRARPGFTDGLQLRALVGVELVPFAVLAWGGESQRGRAMLDLSGSSCGCVDDWVSFRSFLESLPVSRLTRVDVAVDLFGGEFTVDDAVSWREAGEFTLSGRTPSCRVDGDWIEGREGRTLYIGKAKNGKGLRAYEKGKQLGDLASKWVRFEVQFGNRDREIPFEILTEPNAYFVGAYPALERIAALGMEVDGARIATVQNTASVVIRKILDSLKRTYGKWVHVLEASGIEVTDLVEGVAVRAIPARVQSSAVVAGVLRHTTKDAFEQWRSES